jgi:PII-like signaling protein
MPLPRDAMLLRIFIGENDRSPEGRPLYEAIVLKARDVHLAGATVLRGPMGFGHASRLHTTKILRPVGRSAADHRNRRHRSENQRLPADSRFEMTSGLVTLEKVQVLQYGEDVKHQPA